MKDELIFIKYFYIMKDHLIHKCEYNIISNKYLYNIYY